jgi:ATP-dependent helicase/nuclease subunit A
MNTLHIIRASAGSGKTHYLTGFFLKILMREPADYFKKILAVTFTNKATAEMKRRILHELAQLANNLPSHHLQLLIQYSRMNEAAIRKKSALLLETILHDYSWFSVETIDSFFQRVVRSFTHEIGIPGNYAIEIDNEPALTYAVDSFLDTFNVNDTVLPWLIQYTEDKILEGKPWDIRESLVTLGKEIFKEKFSEHAVELQSALSDKNKLMLFRDQLMADRTTFESTISEHAKKALSVIDMAGFTYDDFFKKSNGAKKLFEHFLNLEFLNSSDLPFVQSEFCTQLLDHPDNWPSSSSSNIQRVKNIAASDLIPILKEISDCFEKYFILYNTADEIIRNLYSVGILAEISEKLKEYRISKNVFILSDSTYLINKIINQNDAPFIYEKMGNRYGHFLMDEFQDTSVFQWSNFKPLISNSLSQQFQNLLVGDVKQSIYRWRNSDWKILAHHINNEYPSDILHYEELKTNWRSNERIVSFNNLIFPLVVKRLKLQLDDLLSNSPDHNINTELFETIFKDIRQDFIRKNENKGHIFFHFYQAQETKRDKLYFKDELIHQINLMFDRGYSQNGIVILVRNKKEGHTIANLLISLNAEKCFRTELNIISEESLFLDVSNSVNLIIALLQYINNPADSLVIAKVLSFFRIHLIQETIDPVSSCLELSKNDLSASAIEEILPRDFYEKIVELAGLPLYDITERLINIFNLRNSQSSIPYINGLLDVVHEYIATNPGNLAKFLEYWDDAGKFKTVSSAESQNAIRILTIHKAKGLEFSGVIIPFCNWDLNQKPKTILWAETRNKSLNYLPIVPLNYNKNLKNSEFASEYYSELFKSHVDNLNLLYVALTRAMDTMVVFPVFAENKEGHISNVGDLLYDAFANNLSEFPEFNPLTGIYEVHSKEDQVETLKPVTSEELYFTGGENLNIMDTMFFRTRGLDYFQNLETTTPTGSVRGSVLHGILSEIKTTDDIDSSVKQAVLDGFLNETEADRLKIHLLDCLKDQKMLAWFNGTGTIMAEKDIILPSGGIKRPDRVVIFPDEVHVIDYKSGKEGNIEDHRRQVMEYCRCIHDMEFKKVKGFLWYIDKNEVINI